MSRIFAFLLAGILAVLPLQGQTASLVADLAPGTEEIDRFDVQDLQTVRETALFTVVNAPFQDAELWVSDGTVNGTRTLEQQERCPDICYGSRTILGTLGGLAFWWGSEYGRELLWRSDGTREGTFILGNGFLSLGRTYDTTGATYAFAGGNLYFVGFTEEHGAEIWRTDGSQEGTRLVEDLTPGLDSSSIREITAAGDQVFVFLENEIRVFGPDGSRLLHTSTGSGLDLWPAWKDRLFFREGNTLWVSDGTPAGTHQFFESSGFDHPTWMGSGARGLYFAAADPIHGTEVWRSDGTPQGTHRLTDLPETVVAEPFSIQDTAAVEIGGALLFTAFDYTEGDHRVFRLSAASGAVTPVSGAGVTRSLVQVGNRVLFILSQNLRNCEIWSSGAQGTSARIAADPSCGTLLWWRAPFVVVGDRVVFVTTSTAGTQLWRSDGTPAGTDLLLSRNSDDYRGFAVSASGRRVFVAVEHGLWLWDASEGVHRLVGPGPRTLSSDPSEPTVLGGRLFFNVCSTLWTSTGTAASTQVLAPFGVTACGDSLAPLVAGTSLFFLDPTHQELWKTDAAGSSPVLLIRDLGFLRGLVAHQGRVYFEVHAGAHSEIWTSDGTLAGTHVAVVLPGDTRILSSLASAGNFLYFPASSGPAGSAVEQVWRSDGTPSGTVPLVETSGGKLFVSVGSLVFFRDNWRLWKTDGSPAGTVLSEAEALGSFYNHVEHAGSLYVLGTDDGRLVLWRTNGTPETTIRLATFPEENDSFGNARSRLVPFHGRLFFVADDGLHGKELWATDGTSTGTALVADLSPGPASSNPTELTAAADTLYFSAYDGAHGRELWRTDGTAAGTRLVQDIAPEGLSSRPEHLTVAGDQLYFVADDGFTGRELWKLPLQGPGCQPSSTRLCLNGGRFQIEAVWRDFQGRMGRGMAASLTGDTGYFWFFDPANAEVVLKVLDGRGLNDHHWVFYGALSSVEYAVTVTDTQTGLARRYLNPSGQLASVGDTHGFGPLGAHSAAPDVVVAPPSPPALVSARTEPAAATGTCTPGPRRLCLNNGRFAIEASWKDFQGQTGAGTAVPLTGDTGWFWFFDPSNVEVMLKVLDGTPLNGKFWVFYGALSNVEYTLTVTDTQTGAVQEYRNPSGRFASVADTEAF